MCVCVFVCFCVFLCVCVCVCVLCCVVCCVGVVGVVGVVVLLRLHTITDYIDIAQKRPRTPLSPEWWVPQTQGTSSEVRGRVSGNGRRGEGERGASEPHRTKNSCGRISTSGWSSGGDCSCNCSFSRSSTDDGDEQVIPRRHHTVTRWFQRHWVRGVGSALVGSGQGLPHVTLAPSCGALGACQERRRRNACSGLWITFLYLKLCLLC